MSKSQSQTPISRKTVTDGGSIIQEKYRKLGYSKNTRIILLASWRPGTLKNYSKYIDLWKEFASMNSFGIFSNRVQNVLDFLSKLFSDWHSYNQINTASSALSSIITINKVPCGKHPDVKRFMKDIFELWPIFPKYHTVWDVKKVFNYFRNLPVISDLTFKEISLKLAMLLCLVLGGQRMQTIHLINLKDIKYVGDQVFIPVFILLTTLLWKSQTNDKFNKLHLIIHQILTLKTFQIFIMMYCKQKLLNIKEKNK